MKFIKQIEAVQLQSVDRAEHPEEPKLFSENPKWLKEAWAKGEVRQAESDVDGKVVLEVETEKDEYAQTCYPGDWVTKDLEVWTAEMLKESGFRKVQKRDRSTETGRLLKTGSAKKDKKGTVSDSF